MLRKGPQYIYGGGLYEPTEALVWAARASWDLVGKAYKAFGTS